MNPSRPWGSICDAEENRTWDRCLTVLLRPRICIFYPCIDCRPSPTSVPTACVFLYKTEQWSELSTPPQWHSLKGKDRYYEQRCGSKLLEWKKQWPKKAVLGIRIRLNPELFPRSGIICFGSRSRLKWKKINNPNCNFFALITHNTVKCSLKVIAVGWFFFLIDEKAFS